MHVHSCSECHFEQALLFPYCGKCGALLNQICAGCHKAYPLGFDYCGHCGLAVGSALQRVEQSTSGVSLESSATERLQERRQVVLLFSDLCGFTRLSERLDPEEVSHLIHPLFERIAHVIKDYQGVIEKFIGDAILAFFGIPISHEDDVDRALMAALEIRTIIQAYSKENNLSIDVRQGLNTGVVVASEVKHHSQASDFTVLGDAVNTAARLEQHAPIGKILVSSSVHDLSAERFFYQAYEDIHAKGKALPIQSFELLGVQHIRQAGRESKQLSLIGREMEWAWLQKQSEPFFSNQTVLIALSGEAGIGKSRLIYELVEKFKTQITLRAVHAFAVSYAQHASSALLRQILKRLLDLDENASPDLARKLLQERLEKQSNLDKVFEDLVLSLLFPQTQNAERQQVNTEQSQSQYFNAVSELLYCEAKVQPLILILEDLHWVDSLSLEWLLYFQKYLQERPDVPLFIAVTWRLDAGDLKQNITDIMTDIQSLSVSELSSEACNDLIADYLGLSEIPENLKPLSQRLIQYSQQNPFYLEESLQGLEHEGTLHYHHGQWEMAQEPEQLPLPESLQRLILAKFDRLSDEHRELLHIAAVAGSSCHQTMLAHLLDRPLEQVQALCLDLQQKNYFEPPEDLDLLLFKKAIVRETLYETLLYRRRQDLHGKIACFLESHHEQNIYNEAKADLLAHHFIRAKDTIKALKYLYLAVFQSRSYGASQEVLKSVQKALELLSGSDLSLDVMLKLDLAGREWKSLQQLRSEFVLIQLEVLALQGDFQVLEEIINHELKQTEQIYYKANLYLNLGKAHEKKSRWQDALLAYQQGQQILGQHRQVVEMARLLNGIAWTRYRLGDYAAAEQSANEALSILKCVPDIGQIAYVHNVLGVIYYHRSLWQESLEAYQRSLTLQRQIHDIWGQGNSLNNMGSVKLMTNHWSEAEGFFLESLHLREQLGDLTGIATSCNNLGHIYLQLKQYQPAISSLSRAHEIYLQLGNRLGEAIVLCNRGSAYMHDQNYSQSEENLIIGIALLKKLGAHSVLPEALNELTALYLRTDQLSEAKKSLAELQQSISHDTETLQQGKYQRLWGWYLYNTNQKEQARLALEQSLSLLLKSGQEQELITLYQQLEDWAKVLNWESPEYWHNKGQHLFASYGA